MEACWSGRRRWNDPGKINEFNKYKMSSCLSSWSQSSWSHWFCSLWSESRRAWSQYIEYFNLTLFKIDLDHFYFDNIDFNQFDLTLILITNIFKASGRKQVGHSEEDGMIKVSLNIKKMKMNIQLIIMITLILITLV